MHIQLQIQVQQKHKKQRRRKKRRGWNHAGQNVAQFFSKSVYRRWGVLLGTTSYVEKKVVKKNSLVSAEGAARNLINCLKWSHWVSIAWGLQVKISGCEKKWVFQIPVSAGDTLIGKQPISFYTVKLWQNTRRRLPVLQTWHGRRLQSKWTPLKLQRKRGQREQFDVKSIITLWQSLLSHWLMKQNKWRQWIKSGKWGNRLNYNWLHSWGKVKCNCVTSERILNLCCRNARFNSG